MAQKYDGNPKGQFKGRVVRHLLESEIKRVQEVAINSADAARRLGVSYITYRKYAKLYNLHDEFKKKAWKRCKPPLNRIKIEKLCVKKANHTYPKHMFKERLIRSGLKLNKCSKCDYSEKRLSDGRAPLLIFYKDGDKNNWELNNIDLVCYNCGFLIMGNVLGGKNTPNNKLYDVCRWEGNGENEKHFIVNPEPETYVNDNVDVDINQTSVLTDEELEKLKREAREE